MPWGRKTGHRVIARASLHWPPTPCLPSPAWKYIRKIRPFQWWFLLCVHSTFPPPVCACVLAWSCIPPALACWPTSCDLRTFSRSRWKTREGYTDASSPPLLFVSRSFARPRSNRLLAQRLSAHIRLRSKVRRHLETFACVCALLEFAGRPPRSVVRRLAYLVRKASFSISYLLLYGHNLRHVCFCSKEIFSPCARRDLKVPLDMKACEVKDDFVPCRYIKTGKRNLDDRGREWQSWYS